MHDEAAFCFFMSYSVHGDAELIADPGDDMGWQDLHVGCHADGFELLAVGAAPFGQGADRHTGMVG